MSRSVLLVNPFAVFGSAEDHFAILAEGLVELGWRVTYALPEDARVPTEVVACLLAAKVQMQEIPAGLSRRPIRMLRRLRLRDYDVIHVNHAYWPAILAGVVSRRAVVVTEHTPGSPWPTDAKSRVLDRMLRNRCCWIVLSDRNRTLLTGRGIRSDRINVVAHGLPARRFAKGDRHAAREALGIPMPTLVIGTVGRLALQKRHDLLLRAVRRASDRLPEHLVVIAGDGPLMTTTTQLAAELLPGRVRLLGHRTDIAQVLMAFDMFCLPSDFEGMPFALLEAMACALPAIVSEVAGSAEIIEDRKTGFLVPPDNEEALADALVMAAEHPELRRQMGEAARSAFTRCHRVETMAARTSSVYTRRLGDPNGDKLTGNTFAAERGAVDGP